MIERIQNLVLPDNACEDRETLYHLQKEGGVVSYGTYFNSFSIEKWRKYTEISQSRLCVKSVGQGKLRLVHYRLSKDVVGEQVLRTFKLPKDAVDEQVLCEVELDGEASTWRRIDIPTDVKEGLIGFEIVNVSPDFRLIEGFYEAEISEDRIQTVNLALNICTYRRENFVTQTLNRLNQEILANQESELENHVSVYVQDNGQTLDVKNLENSREHVVYNRNYGGVGGFTRGLIEIMHHMDAFPATHVIMMDDDIEFCTESLYRTYHLLRCRKKEYDDLVVGGTMFAFENPTKQVESGAYWDNGRIINRKKGLLMDDTASCLLHDIEELCHYNAWWYCCMPMSFIRPDNLPIPIFFSGDDIEYGLRNMKHLCILNGICVWHEAFENKYATSRAYYAHRNMLIDNALYCPGFGYGAFAKVFMKRVMKEVVMLRYKGAETLIRATEDYLKGIDFLKNTDPMALNTEVGSLGYQMEPVDEALLIDRSFCGKPRKKGSRLLKLARYFMILFAVFLLPGKDRKTGITALHPMRVTAMDTFRERKILYYDDKSHTGFVTEKNRKLALHLIKEALRVLLKARPCYKKIKQEYIDRLSEVTSESFWSEYLGLSDERA